MAALGAVEGGSIPSVFIIHMNPSEELLVNLPFFRVLLQTNLDHLWSRYISNIKVSAIRSGLTIFISSKRLSASQKEAIIKTSTELSSGYFKEEVPMNFEFLKSTITTPRFIANDLIESFEIKNQKSFKSSFFDILKRPLKNYSSLEGYIVRVKGKRGLRKWTRKSVEGRVLLGTKLDQKSTYCTQIKTPSGTMGLKVTTLNRLSKNLVPVVKTKYEGGLGKLDGQELMLFRWKN